MTWLLLIVGLVLLVAGADLLIKGAARLASNFGVPALVIGLTVVAFGTSAPELAVSIKAAFSGQAELAIANAVGSNIFNVLFILGLAALISPLIISHQLIRQDVPIMVAVSVIAVLMTFDGKINKIEAAILTLGLISYTWFLFYQGKQKGVDVSDGEVEEMLKTKAPMWQNVLLVVGGLVLLVLGARWLVQSAIELAPFKFLDKKRMAETTITALEDVGIHIRNAEEEVGTMSGGERQSIAIGRAVYFGKKLLILDEPTSALSVGETQKVLDYTRAAKDKGMGVVFITHNISQVHAVADRFTVIQRGRKLGDFRKEDVSEEEVARMITAGEVPERLRLFDPEVEGAD
jgi:Ca2+/Na+ antiporter